MKLQHIIVIFILGLGFSCNSNQNQNAHVHGPNGHTHGPSRSRTDQTIWTDKSELFVEYPVLVIGKPSRFAAHFTILDGHKPVETGSVKVTLKNTNHKQTIIAERPSSSGIFKPTLTPEKSGVYTLVFQVNTPTFQDEIRIKNVQVYNSVKEANKANKNSGNDSGISFLKEQAWKMEFQTVKAKTQPVYDVINTSGVWKTSPANRKQIVSTAKGIVTFNSVQLTNGMLVKQGQVLMTVNSRSLTTNNIHAQIQKAKADFTAAEKEYNRKKTLFTKRIIAKSKFEAVEKQYQISKTNYETLTSGYSSVGKQIKAPFNGVLQTTSAKNGDFVNEGDPLFTVAKVNSSLLETYVNPSYYSYLDNIENIWFQTKPDVWSSLQDTKGNIQSVDHSVDKRHPLLSVYVETNAPVEQPNGGFTEVQIAIGNQVPSVVIPKNALLEDYGQYSVIVQTSGEQFERRMVSVGRQNGALVEITRGLESGEVVVTTGAYQVKMASMSGQAPAHGHAH